MIEIPYSGVIKDILMIIWPGKNRRSKLGGVWESKFGFWRGNFSSQKLARTTVWIVPPGSIVRVVVHQSVISVQLRNILMGQHSV